MLLVVNRPWDAAAVQRMLLEEFTWRIEQGEPLRVPAKFYIPNPDWHAGYAEFASGTPGLPLRTVAEALPVAKAFLDPLLNRTRAATGVWDPARQVWAGADPVPAGEVAAAGRLRVLVVAHASGRSAGLGGLPVASGEITRALAAHPGAEVTLLTVGETEPHGAAVIRSIPPNEGMTSREQLYELSRREQPDAVEGLPPANSDAYDVVVGHSRFSSTAAMQIRNRWYPSAALVDVLHMPIERYAQIQGRAVLGAEYARREAVVVRNSDLVVGVGPLLTAEARHLAEGAIRPPNFHELIPGIELLGDVSGPPPGERMHLLFTGRASDPVKGYTDMIATVAELDRRGIAVQVRVRGVQPDELAALQAEADAAVGRPGVVELLPYTTDRGELLQDLQWAHAAVMPSKVEGYGLSGAEAAAHGLPVLVTAESGFGQFLADSGRIPGTAGTAAVVPDTGLAGNQPARAAVWADAVAELRRDYVQRRVEAGRLQTTLAEYTWQDAATGLAQAIVEATPGATRDTVQGPGGAVRPYTPGTGPGVVTGPAAGGVAGAAPAGPQPGVMTGPGTGAGTAAGEPGAGAAGGVGGPGRSVDPGRGTDGGRRGDERGPGPAA
ncbi:glycosyltransferase family 4 protein [Dactylosporangium cerinum]